LHSYSDDSGEKRLFSQMEL